MVPFILSGDEQPVFGRAPRLILPPDARAGETFQTITVSRPNGDVVTTREVRTRNEEQEINPWEGIARPILGAWDIQVRGGGLGRSKRFHLHIAEGCEVIATPAPRYFTEDGVLQPAAVQIRFNGARSDLMLGPGQANGTHQLRTDRDNLTVSVDVDCMWTRIEQPEKLRTIVYETCRVDVEDLAATNLTLHIPRLRSATIELVAGDAVVQSVNKAPNRQGHIALHLGQFRDTTRQYGSAELWCHWDQDRQLVARFRPRRVLTALTVQDDVLQVDRVHESLDVELELALDCAPWYPAARLRVPSGTDQLELPSQLRGRGPMTIVAREYDPWRRAVAHDAAQVSDENIFEIDALVDVTLETVEDEFLRWIKSGGECPDSYEALEFGITHYAAIARARRGARPEVLYRSFANATHEFERGFIETAIQSGWNLAVHGRLFAEGFPATAPAAQRPVFERTWEVSPYLGLLESGARRKDPRLHVQLLHTLGESALSIVETGNDPDAAVGRFAQEAAILAHWPLQRIDDLRAFWLCQSGAFLSPNLRLARSLQLFVNRNALLLVPLIELGDQILHGAKQSLCRIARHDAVAVIAERETRSGWQNLPALSLSLAFTARIAAREDGVTNDAYQRYRDFYADLASLAPEIVEQDLVLAELWLGR